MEQPGISTRAVYSDGLTATTLTYAVYESGSTTPLITSEDEVTFSEKTATVSLSLVSGKKYDIIFWADAPVTEDANNPYTFSAADQTITVDYTSVNSQDESRDAFFADTTITVNGAINETIKLHRPFAQLNIGTTDAVEAAAAGFVPVTSSVKVSNVYNTLNLLDGSVSNVVDGSTTDEDVAVTYALAELPASTETFPVTIDGTTFTYLSMNYLLVAEDKELVDVEFSVVGEDSHEIPLDFASVPVQRNYRTNIYGTLLTDPANFTIIINPDYETPDYTYPSSSEEELLVAAANGGEVTLSESVTLTESLYIAAGKSVVINLNGQTISANLPGESDTDAATSEKDRTIVVEDGASLTINGEGSVYANYTNYPSSIVIGVKGGSLTINGGNYYGGLEGTIYLFNSNNYDGVENPGSIVINGGYFWASGAPTYNDDWYYVLNVQNGAPGTISVTGGTFVNYSPADGDDTGTPSSFLADGYKSVQISETPSPYGTYMVVAEDVTVATNSDDLSSALSNEDVTEIALSTDMTIGTTSISSDKSIDLNGNTLTSHEIDVVDGASLEISNGELASTFRSGDGVEIILDEVTLTTPSSSNTGIELGSSSTRGGNGTLTVTNSTIDVTAYSGSATGIIIQGADNKVVIENTTIIHTYFGITQNGTVPGSDITLNNVTISGTKHGVYLSNNASGEANTLTVNGGSIYSAEATPIEVKKTNLTVDGATLSTDATWQGYFLSTSGACSLGYGIVLAGHTDGTAYDAEACPYSLSNITYLRPNVGLYNGDYQYATSTDDLFNAGIYNGYSRNNTTDRAYKSLNKIENDGAITE